MATLTSFQRFELILIPICFILSLLLILIFGLTIIGNQTLVIMGIPVLVGSGISIFIGYLLNQRNLIRDFNQLELLLRLLVLGGGGALIPLLLTQLLEIFTGYFIFSVLSLVFSLLGGIMSISCLLFLWRTRSIQQLLE